MYLGIDVGGTKTLVASLEDNGVIQQSTKFKTPQLYSEFMSTLALAIADLKAKQFHAIGLGVPALKIDRKEGIAHVFANLKWTDVHLVADIEALTHTPVVMENDAKLAGLSESRLRPNIERLLYVTVSTGIGYSLIVDGKIDPNIGDAGGRLIILNYRGKLMPWESFASGKAIVATYGKMAKDITDAKTWEKIARNISLGLTELIAVTEPNLIVLGGSVGVYLERFIIPLTAAVKQLETPLLKMPTIEQAQRPEEAVVYGCYDYIKQIFGEPL